MTKNTSHDSRSTESHNAVSGSKTPTFRLDKVLVNRGFAKSRERAKNMIKVGGVLVDGVVITKIATRVTEDVVIKVAVQDIPWVSRAGLKLEKAVEAWPLKIKGAVCLDIGASTGGFTEVMLHCGASLVYALDVGHGQLVQSLIDNPRVIDMPGRNIREAFSGWFNKPINFITVDVSFISLEYVLVKVNELLLDGGEAVILIKPQFEVGKNRVKNGIVRSKTLHDEVIDKVTKLAIEVGLTPVDLIKSPIEGSNGNKEFLLYLRK